MKFAHTLHANSSTRDRRLLRLLHSAVIVLSVAFLVVVGPMCGSGPSSGGGYNPPPPPSLPLMDAPAAELSGHTGTVHALAVSSDGKLLVSGGDDRSLRVWDTQDWSMQKTATVGGRVTLLALSQDAKWLAAASSSWSISLWQLPDLRLDRRLPADNVTATSMAFSASGRWLAVGTSRGTVVLHDLHGSAPAQSYHTHRGAVVAVAFVSGDHLITAGSDGYVGSWSIDPWAQVARTNRYGPEINSGSIAAMSAASDGSRVVIAYRDSISILDAPGLQLRNRIEFGGGQLQSLPQSASAVAYGKLDRVAIGSPEGILALYDVKAGSLLALLYTGRGSTRTLALDPEGHYAAAAGGDSRLVHIWSFPSGNSQRP